MTQLDITCTYIIISLNTKKLDQRSQFLLITCHHMTSYSQIYDEVYVWNPISQKKKKHNFWYNLL